ncbi:uncharacterized protein LOC126375457 isoform X1 [Pectinophora gossypiella]|uniref:uncharacterized protein LOC126375457 isoform X1 n=1 Tax=Pectinophora gossypiella TaxID=13191 RepID=UPI00214EAF87|nr:uncharacterized protein LOC126375457 isoform X1 [Pectinophora gossypiella]
MTYPQIVVLILLFVSTNSKSIGNSDKNVTKRETSEDLFPDWVPFKNKKGEQLGEFVQVEPKKPKKRLALPVNFILRAVAEPDGDDYYDKGQGESDGEDYFEKREWSDINRPPPTRATTVAPINHTEISDIDGVVGIIVKHHPSSEILKKTPISQEDSRSSESKEEEVKKAEIAKIKEKNNEQNLEEKKGKRYDDYSDYVDEGNVEKPKQEPTEEQKEAEARKAKILDAVDELKERHEQEQKAISEKMKEEAMHKEELERDFSSSVESGDKYSRKIEKRPDYEEYDDKENTSIEDKYKMYPLRRRTTTTTTTTTIRPTTKRRKDKKGRDSSESGKLSVFRNPSVYMIYDEDMYDSTAKTTQKPKLSSKTTMFIPDTPTTDRRFSSRYTTPAKEEAEDTERISLVPDDSELKEGEPTLFFPKKRKNKRKRKNKSTTYSPQLLDTHVAETIQKKSVQDETTTTPVNVTTVQMTDTTASDSKVSPTGTGPSAPSASGPSASGSGIGTTATSSEESSESQAPASVSTPSGPSAPSRTVPPTGGGSTEVTSSESGTSEKYQPLSAASLTSAVASDAEPAPSDHKKEEHKNEDYEHEKGGEHEHHSEYHSTHGESGKKAYEGTKSKLLMNRRLVQDRSKLKILKAKPWYYYCGLDGKHEDTKTDQGHHDKEDHVGSYHDHGGFDKHHHDEKEHFGAHNHEEHGKKHAEYEENGKHSKGHSTKGSHDIHKKEEYEKKVEFFEEEGDSVEEEKHGGHTEERSHGQGGHFKKGNLNAGYHDRAKGEAGHLLKGGQGHAHKGYSVSGAHDSHGKHGSARAQKHGQAGGKKWVYHHGFPAKNANLVVIDRRADQLYHGPQYYG